jgi:hypothetical protein
MSFEDIISENPTTVYDLALPRKQQTAVKEVVSPYIPHSVIAAAGRMNILQGID